MLLDLRGHRKAGKQLVFHCQQSHCHALIRCVPTVTGTTGIGPISCISSVSVFQISVFIVSIHFSPRTTEYPQQLGRGQLKAKNLQI